MSTEHVVEEARSVPVIDEADICVLGGSCTGVFAAVRAARLGARVVLVERMGCFGGVATISLVNVWHSPLDEVFEKRIIGGLTVELMERLKRRNAVQERERSGAWAWAFNPFEMQIDLDEIVREHGIRPWLHTYFTAPWVKDGKLEGVFVENKSGRGVIKAKQFIDATGDGDLCARLGLETYYNGRFQPSTTCALFDGWNSNGVDISAVLREHGEEYGLPAGFQWGAVVPGTEDTYMLAGTRVAGADCSDGAAFTRAEMEGRRQVRAIMDILRKYAPQVPVNLSGLPARIGIRESRHIRAQHMLTGQEVLHGLQFPDAIANGSYRVDIHYQDRPGITFRYLNGHESYLSPGEPIKESRWREKTETNPTFYQIPYRAIVPVGYPNLLMAGRMIDADTEAHAAIRVMVNMNQTGEAAGVAAYLALQRSESVQDLDAALVRETLADGGSVVI
jgi:glycine/D-amino acid oxidase-like deaminating enzyme